MKVKEYIESGILETYTLGSASQNEIAELLRLKEEYPEIQQALADLQTDMERLALKMAVPPPAGLLEKIEDRIGELARQPQAKVLPGPNKESNGDQKRSSGQFIEVESSSNHMRIHKAWRWVFAAVFILGKIFLAFAIYFYLENRQARKEITKLEQQLEMSRISDSQ